MLAYIELKTRQEKMENVDMKHSVKWILALILTVLTLPIARADEQADREKFFKQLDADRLKVRINLIHWKLRRYEMSCVIESKDAELAKRFSLVQFDGKGNKTQVTTGKSVTLSNSSEETRIIGIFVDDTFLAVAHLEYGAVGFNRNHEVQTWDSFREAVGYMDNTSLAGYITHSDISFTQMKDGRQVGEDVIVTCTANVNMAGVLPL